jgi:hypothetical protein
MSRTASRFFIALIFAFFFTSGKSQSYQGVNLQGDTIDLASDFVLIVVTEYNCKGCLTTLNELKKKSHRKGDWYVFVDLKTSDVNSATLRVLRVFDSISVPKEKFIYELLVDGVGTTNLCNEDFSPYLVVNTTKSLKTICYDVLFNQGLTIGNLKKRLLELLKD